MILAGMPSAIKRGKGLALAGLQDHARSRHPVGTFAVSQVADDIEGSPGVRAFVAVGPCFGEVTEKGVERSRGCGRAER
jgi:hypothetical protein